MTATSNAAPRAPGPLQIMRNGLAIAAMSLKLTMRDRRAFFMSLIFPLFFLFMFGIFAKDDDVQKSREALVILTPRVIGIGMITGAFFGQAISLVTQRERGMLRRYRLTPIGSTGLLIGTMSAGLAMLGITICIQLAIWHFGYGAPLRLHVVPFVIVAFIGAASMASLGMIIGSIAATMAEAQPLMQLALWCALLFSGITVDIEQTHMAWMKTLSVFMPPTHMMRALTHVLLGAPSLKPDMPGLTALLIMTVMAFTIAARLFRWEKDEPLPRKAKLSSLLAITPVLIYGLWLNAHPSPDATITNFSKPSGRQVQKAAPPAKQPVKPK